MLMPREHFYVTCSVGSTLLRILIMIGSSSNVVRARWAFTRRIASGRAKTTIIRVITRSLMCDDIEATVAELRTKGAQFRGPIEQREYGRVIMVAIPGADDIQLYQPTHKLAYNLQ